MSKGYKDFLILPVVLAFIIFASCAYVAGFESEDEIPEATIDPNAIIWGVDETGYGETWYAGGERGTESFSVNETPYGGNEISFYSGTGRGNASTSKYTVNNKHMLASGGDKNYDIIFIDEMTAYDTLSGTTYKRADRNSILQCLISSPFVNESNPDDYYIFKDTGKSIEYFGEMAFTGKWSLATTNTILLYDNRTEETYTFTLLYSASGNIAGFSFGDVNYYIQENQ